MLLATFFVNSTGDETDITPGNNICETASSGGVCTLRAAIEETNALANSPANTPDEIHFSISGAGVHTISPTSALPAIIQPVIIDGYTQDSATADPADDAKPNTLANGDNAVLRIEIDGSSAGANVDGLVTGVANNTFRGLVINRFSGIGIRLNDNSGASDNIIVGNLIGTDVSGTGDLGNGGAGVLVGFRTLRNRIGGTSPADRNVISGNNGNGIEIGGGASSTRVQGNFIGTDRNGTQGLGNSGDGVNFRDPGVGTTDVVIGGTTAGASNVISGNDGWGVAFSGVMNVNSIQGNFIGTDVTGTIGIGNGTAINGAGGIVLASAANTTIGGTTALARNVISGNKGPGIALVEGQIGGPRGTLVQGNFIGTEADGFSPLGNGSHGVSSDLSNNNTIGGTAAGQGNIIAFNSGIGVVISRGGATPVLSNSIFANGGLAINLATGEANSFGVTENDTGDGDGGPNNAQNFPDLTRVTTAGGLVTTIGGRLNSTASTTFRVEFFASVAEDPSGFGEGQTFLGFRDDVTTDANGDATFTFNPPTPPLGGQFITATATDPASNTSEFSCAVASLSTSGTAFSVSNTNDGGPGSLRQAIIDANTNPGLDTISFCMFGTGTQTISPTSPLDTVIDPVIIDGTTQSGASCNTNGPGLGSNAVLLIELNGSGAGAGANGLNITAGGSTVRGLVINRFNGSGIRLATGGGNLVECNYVGTDVTGTLDFGNGDDGVQIDNAPNNTIGGGTAGARNLISGNNDDGVSIFGSGSTGNQVQGNFIGTNANGTAALGNADNGVRLGVGSASNTIGGMASGAGNVISGNGDDGVRISDGSTRNVVQGNAIGTNAFGSAPVPNLSQGVSIQASPANTIGGTAFGASNVISGNNAEGARIEGAESQGNLVHGNLIGTNFAGAMLGNGSHGVLAIGSGPNEIGGTVAGAGNTIAFNGGDGVAVVFVAPSSFFKFIRQNSIFMNAGLGIDLEDDGVTVNDPGDTDTGANDHYNFPILELATVSGGNLTLTGFARPGAAIELFIADPDPTGFGEGKTFLTTLTEGSAADTDNTTGTYGPGLVNGLDQGTDTTNRFSFTIPTPAGVAAGTALTATGTDLNTNTSEFSGNVTVAGPAVCGLTVTTTADVVNAGDMVNSLREAIICANSTPGANTITVPAGTYTLTITGTGEDAAATGDLDITDDLTINGAGAATTIVEAGTTSMNGIDRVFDITATGTVNISGVTIRYGNASTDSPANGGGIRHTAGSLALADCTVTGNTASDVGGGIFNDESMLTINRCTISSNRANNPTREGGGIHLDGGTGSSVMISNSSITNNMTSGSGGGIRSDVILTVVDTIVAGNTATGDGGGIQNDGDLTIDRCLISQNIAQGQGGGIDNSGSGSLTITDSTIRDNTANEDGGGIKNSQVMRVIRSTLSGNTASGRSGGGGGILNVDNGTSAELINVTISGNQATGEFGRGGGIFGVDATLAITNSTITNNAAETGGGIAVFNGTTTFRNTIVANSPSGGNFGGSLIVTSQGHNLSSDNTGAAFLTATGDLNNTDPLLGPLANNGGPTETHLPAPGSPTFDAGDDAVLGSPLFLTTDQRGAGFPRQANAHVDIGAVEGQPAVGCSLIVTTTADTDSAADAVNTLREAINCANSDPDLSTITFAVPANDARHVYYKDDGVPGQVSIFDAMFNSNLGTTSATDDTTIPDIDPDWPHSWYSIRVAALPNIIFPVDINGFSQLGASTNTTPANSAAAMNAVLRIELTAGTGLEADGLRITSGGSTVRGLAIHGFGSFNTDTDAIELGSEGGNTITGNHLGADVSGLTGLSNQGNGVFINNVPDNTVGGTTAAARNLIRGNRNGVEISGTGATDNAIQGNIITGSPNFTGVTIADGASNNTIGGALASAANTITLNQVGVRITGLGSMNSTDNNKVQGNFIGTDAAGTANLPNNTGVLVNFNSDNNVIGGLTDTPGNAPGNVIASGLNGVLLIDTTGTLVQGNLIGTNPAGTSGLGHFIAGVIIETGSNGNTVGGPDPRARNVISSNMRAGIDIQSDGNLVQNNFIGTDISGTADLGNSGGGIQVRGFNNVVRGNVIAFNKIFDDQEGTVLGGGVLVHSGTGNRITSNSIFDNDGLGIELGVDSSLDFQPVLNDAGDTDAGANDLYNFPILESATLGGGNLTLTGFARPGAVIELFIADPDPTGFGEGKTFLTTVIEGSAADTDTGSGSYPPPAGQGMDTTNRFRFVILLSSLPTAVTAGTVLTSTGTDASTNTSEFSGNITVQVAMFDFGDAANTYATLLSSNGPRHQLGSGLAFHCAGAEGFGIAVDADPDGQPSTFADGDDLDADGFDEEGVVISVLTPGGTGTLTICATAIGEVDAFVDFNDDGDFADAGEKILNSDTVSPGVNIRMFTVPAFATGGADGVTFSRFRISTAGGLSFTGAATDGEVEDHSVDIIASDFGDAPSSYGNPSHQLRFGPILGDDIDSEAAAQPNSTATGDDVNGTPDDEDGVTFVGPIRVGNSANVNVEVSFNTGLRGNGSSALLDAFLDFNADGDFADSGEQIFTNQVVFEGTNALSFPVPTDAAIGSTFARFRVSSSGGLSADGPTSDGEVEDYRVTIIGGEGGCEDFALDVPETGEGNVKARVSGGVLKVRGDVLGNGLVIEAGDGPGSYQISGLGATTINRQLGTVQVAGVTGGIQIGLLGGPDVLVLDGTSAELAVTGKLRIRSGTGSTAIIDRALSLFDDHDIVAIVDVLLESGLSVRLRRGSDDLSLCGVDAFGRVRTGEGLGPDTLTIDDSLFSDRFRAGTGVGQDVMSIEQHGNVDGPTTEFDGRVKLRTRRGNDAICIGNAGEPGNSAHFHGRTKIRGGRGRHDSLDAGLDGAGGNTFDIPPTVRGIEELNAGNPACGLVN